MADNEFYAKPPFTLNEGEKIVTSIKPIWKGYFLRYSLGHMIFAAIIGAWGGFSSIGTFGIAGLIGVFLGIFVVISAISIAFAKISYGKFTVWLTDHRVVSAKGTIGYNIESMPLENIVDVVVSRGVLDRILGLSSVMPVPMGGMVMYGRRSGLSTVGFIPALHPDDALKIQKELFDLRNLRKKELKE